MRDVVLPPLRAECRVQIAGDPTVDWVVVVPPGDRNSQLETTYLWGEGTSARLLARAGGAALLTRMLTACAGTDAASGLRVAAGISIAESLLSNPHSRAVTRTFANLEPFPVRLGHSRQVWRIKDRYGQQPAQAAESGGNSTDEPVDCVLIDDANYGFRDHEDRWPAFLSGRAEPPAQVILKVVNPLTGGALWQRLVERCSDRLTVCCTAGDLRKEYAPIGQPLSWERTSNEVARSVMNRPDFAGAARVIVTIGLGGAVIVERGGGATLVFDPAWQENDWERERPGAPTGLGTCLVATLAREVGRDTAAPDWVAGVKRALTAGRAAHEHGMMLADDGARWTYPIEVAADALSKDTEDGPFRAVAVPADERWNIFAAVFPEGYRTAARSIAVEGDADHFEGMPVERMGSWQSVDRIEIESMRSVRNIIREYISQPRRGRPLSIAVFGPPGAGKSFAIQEMAREWTQGWAKMSLLSFNLSQLSGGDALASAFQLVRDCAVEESLPLVFWDEFDAALGGRELGWLAQFLAPMQDGMFVDGSVPRPIGPAIFVFAGGTYATMNSFKARAETIPGAKATDFLSRLRGYVDILGINPVDAADETYLLRRTLLLRSMLTRRSPQLFSAGRLNIDPGVLHAFLDTTAYVHGARSMQSIIEMSSLTGKLRYERSALPARHQLDLHVDATQFLSLVQQESAV
jgi:hypothetical protein